MMENKKNKESSKKGGVDESIKPERRTKSFQKLTTLHSSVEDAKKTKEQDPIEAFINKQIGDILGD